MSEDRGSRMEDRGSRIEDRGSRIEDRGWKIGDRITKFDAIFDPRSSILDPRLFEGAGGRDRSVIARRIVAASSVEDLRRLAAEIRHRLREALSLGYAPVKEREALEKILTAELLEKIPATELVVVEYQRGIVIKGAKDFVGKAQSHLGQIARLPTGGRLLRSLASRGLTVTLVPSSRANEARPDNYRAAVAPGKSQVERRSGQTENGPRFWGRLEHDYQIQPRFLEHRIRRGLAAAAARHLARA